MKDKMSLGSVLLLILAFFIYSSSGIFTKLASGVDFLSYKYILCFLAIVFFLGVYAVLWQIVLKKVPLVNAFLFKSSTVIFALIIASCFFGEHITRQNLVGASIIIAGIVVNSFSYSS